MVGYRAVQSQASGETDLLTSNPDLEPAIAKRAPGEADLTDYDRAHLVTYLRLLDAASEDAPWHEVCRIVLRVDPDADEEAARATYESHLARARWMTASGHQHLLKTAGRA